MLLAEPPQQLRQPGPGDAGKAADAQGAAVGLALLLRLPPQGVAGVDDTLDIGQQMLPLLRQADALAAAQQQRTAQLRLQLADQMGHGRLGIPQLNGSFAKAAALHRGQQRPQLAIIHRNLAFDILHNCFRSIFQYITTRSRFQQGFCQFSAGFIQFLVNIFRAISFFHAPINNAQFHSHEKNVTLYLRFA